MMRRHESYRDMTTRQIDEVYASMMAISRYEPVSSSSNTDLSEALIRTYETPSELVDAQKSDTVFHLTHEAGIRAALLDETKEIPQT